MLKFQTKVAPKSGSLLVASVLVQRSPFTRKVVLLLDHGDEGSLGLTLNYRMEALIQRNSYDWPRRRFPIYHGGPVGHDTLNCLHRGTQEHMKKGKKLLDNVYWGGQADDAYTLIQECREDHIRFFIGYAGWSEGQLEDEILAKQWYVLEGNDNFIFQTPPRKMWSKALQRLGPHYAMLKHYPSDLSYH